MIKEIKYNRTIQEIYNILNMCYPHSMTSDWKYFYYSYNGVNYCLFYFFKDELVIKHNYFIQCGVSENISELELKNIIYERFINEIEIQ